MGKEETVFELVCPCCRSVLWVDPVSRAVVRSEKGAAREKSSLDQLLEKEKERMGAFERKFEATAELAKKKKEKAREKFEKAISGDELEEKDK